MKYNENEPTVWAMNLEDWLVFFCVCYFEHQKILTKK